MASQRGVMGAAALTVFSNLYEISPIAAAARGYGRRGGLPSGSLDCGMQLCAPRRTWMGAVVSVQIYGQKLFRLLQKLQNFSYAN